MMTDGVGWPALDERLDDADSGVREQALNVEPPAQFRGL